MKQLHYHPGNASMAPHVLLHELGTPFELVFVDRDKLAHRSPAYLKLNPNGLIPVYVDADLVLFEAAAICLHLADSDPAAALAPALGTPERAHYYKWLVWMTNTLQATLLPYFYPERWVNAGDAAAALQVQAQAQYKVGGLLAQIDAQLARHGQDWLLSSGYSAADAYAFMLCRWTRGFSSLPAREYSHIGPYLQRLLARPAVQRMLTAEGLAAPWV